MRVRLYFSFILLLLAWRVGAQELFTPPVKSNSAFKAGENLTYQIRYGIISAGVANFSLTEEIYNDKVVLRAITFAQTTGLADKLYEVNDSYESWFDKKTCLPYKQARSISEGNYKTNNEVTYNRKNNTVNSKLSGIHGVPAKILDLTSTFYYLRRVDYSKVKEGAVVAVNMYFSDAIFPCHIVYKGKENIKTKFGEISCIKLSPVVEVGRMFKSTDDLSIWFTDDENCIPVLVKMDIRVVGAVYLKLIKYENTVNPMVLR